MRSRASAFLKIGANRLLDREKPRRKSVPASTIIESAEADGLLVVATDVANDEDAVSLIDLGLDLMAGPRFGGPEAAEARRRQQARPPASI